MYEKEQIAKVFKDFCNVERTVNEAFTVLKVKGCYNISIIMTGNLFMYSRESTQTYYTFNRKKLKDCLALSKDYKAFKDACLSFCAPLLPPYVSETLLQENVAKWAKSVDLDITDILFLQDKITYFWDNAQSREDVKDNKVYSFLSNLLKTEKFCSTFYDAMNVASKLVEQSKEYNEQFIFCINFLSVIYTDFLKDLM